MSVVGAFEAKTHLPALLERVKKGEQITITKRGVPVAKLVPAESPVRDRAQVIEELRKFRFGKLLGESETIRGLIEEGRRF
jgi:prevent-host-death family protein